MECVGVGTAKNDLHQSIPLSSRDSCAWMILAPFYRWGYWGCFTVNGRDEIYALVSETPKPRFFPLDSYELRWSLGGEPLVLLLQHFFYFFRREVSVGQRLAPSGWCWTWLWLQGSGGLADESQATLSDRGENTVELTGQGRTLPAPPEWWWGMGRDVDSSVFPQDWQPAWVLLALGWCLDSRSWRWSTGHLP